MMGNTHKFSAVLIAILLIVPCLLIFSSAFAVDIEREVSLEITDIPFANIKFLAYRVASFDENGILTPDDEFVSVDTDFNGVLDHSVLSDTLYKKVLAEGIKADAVVESDEYGSALFDGSTLEVGLYLITSEKITMDGKVYSMCPFMVTLPYKYDGGTAYNVFASAKFDAVPAVDVYAVSKIWDDDGSENKRPEKIDIVLYCDGEVYDEISLPHDGSWRYEWHDLPSEHTWWVEEKSIADYKSTIEKNGTSFVITNKYIGPTPDEDVPATGQLWWPVPILICAGLFLVSRGVVRRVKTK